MNTQALKAYFDAEAPHRERWQRRNWYYHKTLSSLVRFLVPEGSSVLDIGSGTGYLLASLKAKRALGVDLSPEMVGHAQRRHPQCHFRVMDAHALNLSERFDYVLLSDSVGYFHDVETVFRNLEKVCHENTRVVITYFNYAWEPILKLAEALGLKAKQPLEHWLSERDIENLLSIAGFDVVKRGKKMLVPFYIPLVSPLLNRFVANLPVVNRFCLIQYVVARPLARVSREYSVSVVVPARNERGNIEQAVTRLPHFGSSQEIIFVEGHSTDGTALEIRRVAALHGSSRTIKTLTQHGKGKGDAVRLGFAAATGEILMILDADLTVPPEDLPKFYEVLKRGRGELVNGSRLVYPMEKEAMRFLNVLANKAFSLIFTYLLGQRIKDTLCGTKALFKSDYERIARGREYFGDFDPFGDFDLLFGAAKLNLKIVELPVHYRARTYGTTQIQRWKHGWLLLKMCIFAARTLKLRE